MSPLSIGQMNQFLTQCKIVLLILIWKQVYSSTVSKLISYASLYLVHHKMFWTHKNNFLKYATSDCLQIFCSRRDNLLLDQSQFKLWVDSILRVANPSLSKIYLYVIMLHSIVLAELESILQQSLLFKRSSFDDTGSPTQSRMQAWCHWSTAITGNK